MTSLGSLFPCYINASEIKESVHITDFYPMCPSTLGALCIYDSPPDALDDLTWTPHTTTLHAFDLLLLNNYTALITITPMYIPLLCYSYVTYIHFRNTPNMFWMFMLWMNSALLMQCISFWNNHLCLENVCVYTPSSSPGISNTSKTACE